MQHRILIVDDDELILSSLKMFLTYEKYLVATLSNPDLIHSAISDFDPQLIILDIWFDHADGRIICDKLKLNEETAHIHIILLTALSYDQIAASDCMADAIIGKPYQGSSLLSTVQHLVG